MMNLKQKEDSFMNILTQFHREKKADWINVKHIRKVMFGDAMDEKALHKARCRIYSIAESLEKQGKIRIIKKQKEDAPIGRVYENFVQIDRRNQNGKMPNM